MIIMVVVIVMIRMLVMMTLPVEFTNRYFNDNFSYLGADWSALLWNKLCRHIDGNGNVPGEASSASGVW